jgi:hypothetical protein
MSPPCTVDSALEFRSYTEFMSNELTRGNVPMRRLPRRNLMSFPRELREAIPDLHAGRALELDSINGHTQITSRSRPPLRRWTHVTQLFYQQKHPPDGQVLPGSRNGLTIQSKPLSLLMSPGGLTWNNN